MYESLVCMAYYFPTNGSRGRYYYTSCLILHPLSWCRCILPLITYISISWRMSTNTLDSIYFAWLVLSLVINLMNAFCIFFTSWPAPSWGMLLFVLRVVMVLTVSSEPRICRFPINKKGHALLSHSGARQDRDVPPTTKQDRWRWVLLWS